jgi:hypothetical protein
MGDLTDHPAAMSVFRETLIRHLPEAAAYFGQADASSTAVTVRQVGAMVPGGEQFLAELAQQFAALT